MQSSAFELERLCIGQTFPLVNCRSGGSQIFKQSQKHLTEVSAVPSDLRRWHGSKKEASLLALRASSKAFSRFKNGLAAEDNNRMAALGSTMAAVVGALEMERDASLPPGQSAHCSSYAASTAEIPSCLASVSRATEPAFVCLLICVDNSYRHFPAQVTFFC